MAGERKTAGKTGGAVGARESCVRAGTTTTAASERRRQSASIRKKGLLRVANGGQRKLSRRRPTANCDLAKTGRPDTRPRWVTSG